MRFFALFSMFTVLFSHATPSSSISLEEKIKTLHTQRSQLNKALLEDTALLSGAIAIPFVANAASTWCQKQLDQELAEARQHPPAHGFSISDEEKEICLDKIFIWFATKTINGISHATAAASLYDLARNAQKRWSLGHEIEDTEKELMFARAKEKQEQQKETLQALRAKQGS